MQLENQKVSDLCHASGEGDTERLIAEPWFVDEDVLDYIPSVTVERQTLKVCQHA